MRLGVFRFAAIARALDRHGVACVALVMLAFGLLFAEPCPHHWSWDTFAYLDAVLSGRGFVPLIWGRTAFCAIGSGLEKVARLIGGTDDPFHLFRIWTAAGFGLAAVALLAAGRGMRHALGGCAATVVVAYYVSHADTVVLWIELWPENWSLAAAMLSAGALLGLPVRARADLWASAILAVASVALKETAVAFVPALALVVLARERGGFGRRFAIAAAWAAVAAAAGLASHFVPRLFMPDLAVAQRQAVGIHLDSVDGAMPEWPLVRENIAIAARTLWSSPIHVLLAGAGLLRALSALHRPARSRRLLWMAAIAAAGFAGPFVAMTVVGHPLAIARYSRTLVPGMALMAAVLAMPAHGRSGGRSRFATFAAIAIIALCAADWDGRAVRWHTDVAWRDYARFGAMKSLCDEPLAIVAADDSWAAHFVHVHACRTGADYRWTILWPHWHDREGARSAARAWVDGQLADGRRIAIAPSLAERAGLDLPAMLAEFAPLEFEEHPAGWWISRPADP